MLKLPIIIYKTARPLIFIIFFIILLPTSHIIWFNKIILLEWNILRISCRPIIFHLIADPIGIIFSCTVLFISANVLSFSTIYIKNDIFINRFTIIVLLFVLSINILIFLPHFIILLLGWDGLGFTSFILVIYYQNSRSLSAGIITALSNRIGDAIILIAIACTLHQGHWYIINIRHNPNIISSQTILIILAAITKRAQIPFSRWLPAAIAAPTPVSALVHSSTLVTAGVFLLIRFYPFLHSINNFNLIITIIAASTIIIAGLRALRECDIKKIIALSTLRQLGLIILAIGINIPKLAYSHIITHALFKALLFICAGSLINYHNHTQDLRWIGITTSQIPITTTCITVANIALCGLPFISGFYSKDIIIEWTIHSPTNYIIFILSILSIRLTRAYSIRFSIATLWSPHLCTPSINLKEKSPIIKPIILLSLIATISGRSISWTNISTYPTFIPIYIKIMPLIIIIIGTIIIWFLTIHKIESNILISPISHWASCIIWFLTPLSSQFTIKYPITISHNLIKTIDQGLLELPQLIHLNISTTSNKIILNTPIIPTTYIILSRLSITYFILIIYILFVCSVIIT